jgi:hypothetical protein
MSAALMAQARSRNGSRCCPTCAAEFMPTRADAQHCSGACRQKAYRRRKA